ncbi:TPA: DNA alkylation repair protein, partial [Candidatus Woesearchaeota archaeon]|nr:DNA alkylation repair protein [Candidatus Woesearchaeota archaeon]
MLSQFKEELRSVATKERAKTNEWFFKTGKGKYGEGDTFLGIRMPDLRKIVKRHLELSFVDIQELINSPFHEERMAGLLVLVYQYEKNKVEKKAIAEFYLKNTKKINNWDLVDCSSPQTLGLWLVDRDTSVLYKLAKS